VPQPLQVGDALVVTAPNKESAKFRANADNVIVISLDPRSTYEVEIDDQELKEEQTDVGGTLVLNLPKNTDAGVRLRKRTK